MTDPPLFGPPLTGGSTQEVPLTPAYRSALEQVMDADERVVVASRLSPSRGLAGGLQESHQLRDARTGIEAAKQDVEDGNFLRYCGPLRLTLQTVDYKKPFSFRHISLEIASVSIPGRSLGLPSADNDVLAAMSGDLRSLPGNELRTITATGEVDFAKWSAVVFAVRGPDGATIYLSEHLHNSQ